MFEQSKWILRSYRKTENVNEVQKQKSEFGTTSPTHVKLHGLKSFMKSSGLME